MRVRESFSETVGSDLAAGLVVFFVALPLCLGIALASGAPLISGIVAGIIGGIVVGSLSKSSLSVTGPAAGLTAVVLSAVSELGTFELFLTAVVLAGVIQIALGVFRAGVIANYLPASVVDGMLAGIGVIIILKQIPHAVGYDVDFEGSHTFAVPGGTNTLSTFLESLRFLHAGAAIIGFTAIGILMIWERVEFLKKIKLLPGPLVAVLAGIVLNELFSRIQPELAITNGHLVSLPVLTSGETILGAFKFPDLSGLSNWRVWSQAAIIAVVASIETLLCIEAIDRLDPKKRSTPTNRELKAQGLGNIISGFLGGLPMTSVIVRSSANLNAQAQTKLSTIFHGVLLLVCFFAIPTLLNRIPLSSLAAILILTGFKLAKPSVFIRMWKNGIHQFAPFIVTITAVVFTDLLTGVGLGLCVSIILLLRENMKSPYVFVRHEYSVGDIVHVDLRPEVSFLHKAAFKLMIEQLPENCYVVIDASQCRHIDFDVLALLREFASERAAERGIRVQLVGFDAQFNLRNSLVHRPVYVERRPIAEENIENIFADEVHKRNQKLNGECTDANAL